MLGCIDFNIVNCSVEGFNQSKRTFEIHIDNVDRVFKLRCSTGDDLISWTTKIYEAILDGQACVKDLHDIVAHFDQFWRHDYLSESEFLNNAQTGDILLFKTKNFMAKVQRLFTQKEYDHAALIVK